MTAPARCGVCPAPWVVAHGEDEDHPLEVDADKPLVIGGPSA